MYVVTKIEDQECGWFIENEETKEKYIVFCNPSANTAEDALAVITPSLEEVQE